MRIKNGFMVTMLLAVAACGGASPFAPKASYTVGGSIQGLSGSGLVLQNNQVDNLPIDGIGEFVFSNSIEESSSYSVTVLNQPINPAQSCSVDNASGVMADVNVSNVSVNCVTALPAQYTVAGTVSGLSGLLVVQNSGDAAITISADGSFVISDAVLNGYEYDVAIVAQPAGQQCSLINAQGTVSGQNIANLDIACFTALSLNTVALSQQVSVSWNDVGAMAYDLYYSTGASCTITEIDNPAMCPAGALVSGATPPYDVLGLVDAQDYFFLINASYDTGHAFVSAVKHDRPDSLVANGPILTMQTSSSSGTTYMGGDFTRLAAKTGHGVPVAISAANVSGQFPIVDGVVQSVAADGLGGWYIGGEFLQVAGQAINYLAHINPDGTLDLGWMPNPDGPITKIAVNSGTVYVSGQFSIIAGQSRAGLGAFTSGALTAWNPAPDGIVNDFAFDGGSIFLGGGFLNIAGASSPLLAVVDATTGALEAGWASTVLGVEVNALLISADTLYLAGNFASADGGATIQRGLAAMDLITRTANAWAPDVQGTVYALSVSAGVLYVGGDFSSVGSGLRNNLAAYTLSTGNLLSWNPNTNGVVYSVMADSGTVYVAGGFTAIGPEPRPYMAALDKSLDITYNWQPHFFGTVRSMAMFNGVIYAGGEFTGVGGVARARLAALDSTGSLLAWKADADAPVNALALHDAAGLLYVGGEFASINNSGAHTHLVGINLSTGAVVISPQADNTVNALLASHDGNTLYVGGVFQNIAGVARSYIASLDISTGLSTAWDPAANGAVRVFDEYSSGSTTLYVGGDFTFIGGAYRNYLAAFDNSDVLPSPWNPTVNDSVTALQVSGSTVYVGGSFTQVNGATPQSYLASFAVGTNGAVLPWSPSLNGSITSLSSSVDTLYVGGYFSLADGWARNYAAAYDMLAGSVSSWDPQVNGPVSVVDVVADSAQLGGYFTRGNNQPLGCLLR